jgi:hypothetical protein
MGDVVVRDRSSFPTKDDVMTSRPTIKVTQYSFDRRPPVYRRQRDEDQKGMGLKLPGNFA